MNWNLTLDRKHPSISTICKPEKDKFTITNPDSYIDRSLMDKMNQLEAFDPTEGECNELINNLMEDIHHSELIRIFENADERDILAVCYVAVRRFPVKYLTVLMDYLLEKEGK